MQVSSPHDLDSFSTKLPPLNHHDNDRKLPSLSSIAGIPPRRSVEMSLDHKSNTPTPQTQNGPELNGTLAYRQPPPHSASQAESPATMDMDGSNSVTSGAPTPGRHSPNNSLNLEDPDVRLAAQALGDLRADFLSSPPDTTSLTPASPQLNGHAPSASNSRPQHSEPLLSLLTTAHPFVASTIGGASVAYGGAKNFSPRFKSGAEYVEGYLTPLAKTVNSVGRATGVEGGVRWFLGSRRQAAATDSDATGNSKKRRKVGDENDGANKKTKEAGRAADDDAYSATPKSERRLSASTVDTLPAYDELRSPAYTETAVGPPQSRSDAGNASWQSRLIMSTSGLSVAMSAESLRSLKYCLKWLRWSNDHMSQVIGNLKSTLDEFDKTADKEEAGDSQAGDGAEADLAGRHKTPEQARTELTAKIHTLKIDVVKTLQDVTNTVSKYAGGALPENARILVRRHLTSLPQRFRIASMTDSPSDSADSDSAVREGAQKVLVLAREGLDMVTQVTGVLDGTIVSAEQWCERMGRKRRPSKDAEDMEISDAVESSASRAESAGDVPMAA